MSVEFRIECVTCEYMERSENGSALCGVPVCPHRALDVIEESQEKVYGRQEGTA